MKCKTSNKYAQKLSERGIYKHAFQIAKSFTVYSEIQNNQTEILVAQQKILKNIAENGNAVINYLY